MNTQKKVLFASVAIFLLSLIFGIISEYFCESYRCQDRIDMFAIPAAFLSLPWMCTMFILRSRSRKIFEAWWRFARVYLPIAFTIILISPAESGSGLVSIDAELITWWLSGIFFVISIFLITPRSSKFN